MMTLQNLLINAPWGVTNGVPLLDRGAGPDEPPRRLEEGAPKLEVAVPAPSCLNLSSKTNSLEAGPLPPESPALPPRPVLEVTLLLFALPLPPKRLLIKSVLAPLGLEAAEAPRGLEGPSPRPAKRSSSSSRAARWPRL